MATSPITALPGTGREIEEFLILLHANLSKVPTLTAYVNDANIIPSTAFTSASISRSVDALNGSVDLVSDCLMFADLLRVYSFNFFGSGEKFFSILGDILKAGRSACGNDQPIYKLAVDDFYFQDIAQLTKLIDNNELLVVIYAVSLINFILNE